ncbi:uncharacterized protein EI97DRAFT_16089 [Westerdykella ornata]|uniref:Uncharacterized protein n=1 Tax=Westerdykella ornata TaxID=318751 RepID=A0A6A6JY12_WESOR|nr:uncharacterized protein EI97DRAFT_16089 [Westerdykella ornata]KAF2280973.1 hypothetical protein EI97DRAFT_16089 [Westerdykella ornata]
MDLRRLQQERHAWGNRCEWIDFPMLHLGIPITAVRTRIPRCCRLNVLGARMPSPKAFHVQMLSASAVLLFAPLACLLVVERMVCSLNSRNSLCSGHRHCPAITHHPPGRGASRYGLAQSGCGCGCALWLCAVAVGTSHCAHGNSMSVR